VAKVGTSNSDRAISLRLHCIVKKHNILSFYSHFLPKLSLTQSILITTFTSRICLWGGVYCCQHFPRSVSASSASLVAACWEKLLPLLPWCSVSNSPLSSFPFVHLALVISLEDEVLRLGTLVPMNIEVPTKYQLSQDRIVVFEIRLHCKSPMPYRPALHGNWNTLSFVRRALKDKFPTPTVPLTTVLPNRQVFLPDLVY
jgi:hypothetical protein